MEPSDFFSKLEYQDTPLAVLTEFLQAEQRLEQAQQIDKMRFVGYVLELGYDTATIITSDPYKVTVGGIPRGSFLILAPQSLKGLPPHFTLLRVMETAPTPLSLQVQQTYFELHKKSMPELDVWTQSELQWGALRCSVLGMFYPEKDNRTKIAFSGDVNTVVSAHRYRVYAPDEALLDIVVNGLVRPKQGDPVAIGELRPTENQLASIINSGAGNDTPTTVKVSVEDFKGARTAMFGKTRLGKSNVVKLLAQAVIYATMDDRSVGQLIFDINGEYANDNEWDGSKSIRSVNEAVCDVYALTKRPNTPSRPLRLNFYEQPSSGIEILGSMLEQDNRKSDYIEGFTSVALPTIEEVRQSPDYSFRTRGIRRIQTYWAILHVAGFEVDEARLRAFQGSTDGRFQIQGSVGVFDPKLKKELRAKVYGQGQEPDGPRSLDSLTEELNTVIAYIRNNPSDNLVKESFQADDHALFDFLVPKRSGSTGPTILNRYRGYHDAAASDFVKEILTSLDAGRTVILDLGNANDKIRVFFADTLSRNVFAHQEAKFTSNSLGRHFVQLYFEEAHNLFPATARDLTGVYARFAKEGAKFHIGMTYSTQSPSTIYGELLNQTENFFVGHLSSSDETRTLTRLQRAFAGVEEEIMRARTPGFMRMLTQSHRFVVPVQTRLFETGGES
ncbi:MAG: helicase HerA domain-containing protein [Pseudonocardiaceae bacterium]